MSVIMKPKMQDGNNRESHRSESVGIWHHGGGCIQIEGVSVISRRDHNDPNQIRHPKSVAVVLVHLARHGSFKF